MSVPSGKRAPSTFWIVLAQPWQVMPDTFQAVVVATITSNSRAENLAVVLIWVRQLAVQGGGETAQTADGFAQPCFLSDVGHPDVAIGTEAFSGHDSDQFAVEQRLSERGRVADHGAVVVAAQAGRDIGQHEERAQRLERHTLSGSRRQAWGKEPPPDV